MKKVFGFEKEKKHDHVHELKNNAERNDRNEP